MIKLAVEKLEPQKELVLDAIEVIDGFQKPGFWDDIRKFSSEKHCSKPGKWDDTKEGCWGKCKKVLAAICGILMPAWKRACGSNARLPSGQQFVELLEKWRYELYVVSQNAKVVDLTKSTSKAKAKPSSLISSSSATAVTCIESQEIENAIEDSEEFNEPLDNQVIVDDSIAIQSTTNLVVPNNYLHPDMLAFILVGPFSENNSLLCSCLFEENAIAIITGSIPIKQQPSEQIIIKPTLNQKEIREIQKTNDLKNDFSSPVPSSFSASKTSNTNSSNALLAETTHELKRKNDFNEVKYELKKKKIDMELRQAQIKELKSLIKIQKERGLFEELEESQNKLMKLLMEQ